MDFPDLVRRARSYRRFDESRPIPEGVVRDLVDTARLCPSGANAQPLRYRIVTDPAEVTAVFGRCTWAGALKDWDGPEPGERPTAWIVVCAQAGRKPQTDLGISGYAIQLGATAAGYAACMLGAIDRVGIQADLGIGDGHEVLLAIALGAPGESIALEPLPEDGATAYWRDEDGGHHVPKRALADVLI